MESWIRFTELKHMEGRVGRFVGKLKGGVVIPYGICKESVAARIKKSKLGGKNWRGLENVNQYCEHNDL